MNRAEAKVLDAVYELIRDIHFMIGELYDEQERPETNQVAPKQVKRGWENPVISEGDGPPDKSSPPAGSFLEELYSGDPGPKGGSEEACDEVGD